MNIIPAILPKNPTELNTKINQVLGLVSWVQVDVCDGKFVPSKTQFDKLPHLDQIEYEFDLMVAEPENTLERWIELQPARMIIHLESVKDFEKLLVKLKPVRGMIQVGFCISNDTPNELLEKYIDQCNFVQLMGIANIGFQGQSFDTRVIDKIIYFHTKYPKTSIAVDGAVNSGTIKQLADAGATRFIAGSAVFDQGDVGENIKTLESLVQ